MRDASSAGSVVSLERPLAVCHAEGCCWVGDKFLAITKKCFEVGSYAQHWEDAAGSY